MRICILEIGWLSVKACCVFKFVSYLAIIKVLNATADLTFVILVASNHPPTRAFSVTTASKENQFHELVFDAYG